MDVSNTTSTDTQYRPTTSPPKRGPAVDWKDLRKGQRIPVKDPDCPFEIYFKIGKRTLSRKCEKPMRLVSLDLLRGSFTIRCYTRSSKPSPPPPQTKTRTAAPATHTPPAAQAAR